MGVQPATLPVGASNGRIDDAPETTPKQAHPRSPGVRHRSGMGDCQGPGSLPFNHPLPIWRLLPKISVEHATESRGSRQGSDPFYPKMQPKTAKLKGINMIQRFTIILDGLPEMTIEASNRLYEAGCDDSTPGSRAGVSHVEFHRQSDSLREAILSAIRDVQKAGFKVASIESDEFSTIRELNDQLQTA
jgi:hypothetical protein